MKTNFEKRLARIDKLTAAFQRRVGEARRRRRLTAELSLLQQAQEDWLKKLSSPEETVTADADREP